MSFPLWLKDRHKCYAKVLGSGQDYSFSNNNCILKLLISFVVPFTAPPSLYITPQMLSVRAGEVLQIQCVAEGTPPIVIQWSKVGGQLSQAASERDGILRIQPVTAADAGRYRCLASNEAGRSELYADVSVMGECIVPMECLWTEI